jgi:hypothetical protein
MEQHDFAGFVIGGQLKSRDHFHCPCTQGVDLPFVANEWKSDGQKML